jgi:hypothetical protein
MKNLQVDPINPNKSIGAIVLMTIAALLCLR